MIRSLTGRQRRIRVGHKIARSIVHPVDAVTRRIVVAPPAAATVAGVASLHGGTRDRCIVWHERPGKFAGT